MRQLAESFFSRSKVVSSCEQEIISSFIQFIFPLGDENKLAINNNYLKILGIIYFVGSALQSDVSELKRKSYVVVVQ